MTILSLIDPSQPTTGTPTTASIRNNFANAKQEIERNFQTLADYEIRIRDLEIHSSLGTPANPAGNSYLLLAQRVAVTESIINQLQGVIPAGAGQALNILDAAARAGTSAVSARVGAIEATLAGIAAQPAIITDATARLSIAQLATRLTAAENTLAQLLAGGGANGATGAAGPAGPSAYELALQAGFTGNLATWLASLVGPAGATGQQGPTGAAGANGSGSSGSSSTQRFQHNLIGTILVDNTDWVNVAQVNEAITLNTGFSYLVSYRATLQILPTIPNQEIFSYFAQGDGLPIPLTASASFTETAPRSLIMTDTTVQKVIFNQTLQIEASYQFNHYVRSNAPFSLIGLPNETYPTASKFVTYWRT